MSDHSLTSGQSGSTVTTNPNSNYGASQYNSKKFNILEHLDKLTPVEGKQSPSQGEYYCPVCGAKNFHVNLKTGKYNTHGCTCNHGVASKQTFIRAITGETTSSARNTLVTPVYKKKPSSTTKQESGTPHPTIKKVPNKARTYSYRYFRWDEKRLQIKGIADPLSANVRAWELEPLVKVIRTDDGNGGKKIIREPSGAVDSKALPYGMDTMCWLWDANDRANRTLFIVEGERTADTLNNLFREKKIKAFATTNIGGAGKWRESHTEIICKLGFQRVVLCPDGDRVGVDHMVDVYKQFESKGIKCGWLLSDERPCSELEKSGGIDMADIIDGGHLEDDYDLLDAIASPEDIAWLNRLLSLTVEDEDVASDDDEDTSWLIEDIDAWLLAEDDEDEWIIDGLISAGSNIIAAPSGTGKSILTTQIAMSIITGKPILDCEVRKQGKVLYHCSDEPTRRLKKRLIAQGILDAQDRDKFIPLMKVKDGNKWNYSHLKELEMAFKKHKPVAFIMDSLRSITKPLGIKEKDEEMGQVVTCLKDICEKYSVALVIVHHNRKDSTSDLNSVVGSGSIVSPVDVVWSMAKNPSKGKFARKLSLVKNRQGEDEIAKHLLLDGETLTFTVNHDVSDGEDEDEDSSSERKVSAKDKILDCLKSRAGCWVSIDDLVEDAGVTRTNITTAIGRLKGSENIETGKGCYRWLG